MTRAERLTLCLTATLGYAVVEAVFALVWPQIAERELAVAIALEPRVERRLLLKLRQLAERWGRVTPGGRGPSVTPTAFLQRANP